MCIIAVKHSVLEKTMNVIMPGLVDGGIEHTWHTFAVGSQPLPSPTASAEHNDVDLAVGVMQMWPTLLLVRLPKPDQPMQLLTS